MQLSAAIVNNRGILPLLCPPIPHPHCLFPITFFPLYGEALHLHQPT